MLLKGLKETKLITTGAYAITSNPLYSAFIVLILPGTALVLNSWIMLTVPIVGYVIFKFYIKQEYAELEKFFGEEYRKYRASTPELFPLQVHKWFRRRN
jgi:protein-S-isoprenylcysteine O-methyltransferase Ste14